MSQPLYLLQTLSEAAKLPSVKSGKAQVQPGLVDHGFRKNRAVRMPLEELLHKFKHQHRKHDEGILKAKLTRDNYREKFHQLLCREEDEHRRILEERY